MQSQVEILILCVHIHAYRKKVLRLFISLNVERLGAAFVQTQIYTKLHVSIMSLLFPFRQKVQPARKSA
jgi:hypothetical protein